MTIPRYVQIFCGECGSPEAEIENTDYYLEGRFRIASCPNCDWYEEYDNRDKDEPGSEDLDPN